MDGYGSIEGEADNAADRINERSGKSSAAKSPLKLRVVVAIRGDGSLLSLEGRPRYLQVIQSVPEQLAFNAEALRKIGRAHV